ncbi:MAG: polysaccharide deacetylase family protein, partial [Chitinophagaceae bacterium]|nr:polysaccharide deacetylase family protein [Chitinophagaceae bacterium]
QKNKDSVAAQLPLADTQSAIYLTFDDGPNNGTGAVLAILENEKVPAAFFLIGAHLAFMKNAEANLKHMRSLPLIEMYNHSFTHGYRNQFDSFYADVERITGDFDKAGAALGISTKVARTPGNNIWRTKKLKQTTYKRYAPAADKLYAEGYQLFGWDHEWFHYKNKLTQNPEWLHYEVDSMLSHNKVRAPGHLILLMHDACFVNDTDSLKLVQFIQQVKTEGKYTFRPVSHHPLLSQP